jgi:hypothetical protein
MRGTSSTRRHYRPALRVRPLEPIAQRSVTENGKVFARHLRCRCDWVASPMAGGGDPSRA